MPARSHRILLTTLLSLGLLSGCLPGQVPTGTEAERSRKKPAVTSTAAPEPTPTPEAVKPPVLEPYFGRVLGVDGQPAAGVLVRGFLLSNNGGGLIGNNGGGLISDQGGSLISDQGAGYRLLASGLETRTDARGRFTLADPDGLPLNLEAVMSDGVKAIRFEVPSDAEGVTLQLAPTGAISGQVKAEGDAVTDLINVDVFVPGTSYVAKTDSEGRFSLSNLPAGTFSLYAVKRGLGAALVTGVEVKSEQSVTAPELVLKVDRPVLSALSVSDGGPGTEVTVSGEHFGKSKGKDLSVTIGGSAVTAPDRVDDQTIKLKVPQGGSSGDLVVTVDGVPSNALPFQVHKSLAIATSLRDMPLGLTLPFTARAVDTDDKANEAPTVRWRVETGDAVAVDAQGRVTALKAGEATLVCETGSVEAPPVSLTVHDAARVVATVAGGSTAGKDDGFGLDARFYFPKDLAIADDGTVYVVDEWNDAIRVVSPQGVVRTLEVKLPAGETRGLSYPAAIALGPDGQIYVADQYRHRVVKLTPEGDLTVIAGGTRGTANGTGASAQFSYPQGIAVAADGTIYVADTSNHRIRMITTGGVVTTLAGGTRGLANGTGTAASFDSPIGLALDGDTALYVADKKNMRLRKIALSSGEVTTLETTGEALSELHGLARDAESTLYATTIMGCKVLAITPGGEVSVFAGSGYGQESGPVGSARFAYTYGLAFGPDGSLYLSEGTDGSPNRLRRIFKAP